MMVGTILYDDKNDSFSQSSIMFSNPNPLAIAMMSAIIGTMANIMEKVSELARMLISFWLNPFIAKTMVLSVPNPSRLLVLTPCPRVRHMSRVKKRYIFRKKLMLSN